MQDCLASTHILNKQLHYNTYKMSWRETENDLKFLYIGC